MALEGVDAARREVVEGLRDAGLHVVAGTGAPAEAVTLVKRLRPDALIIDLAMVDDGGLDLVCSLRPGNPHTRIVVLLPPGLEALAVLVLRLGADGCVASGARPPALGRAVRRVLAGETVLADEVAAQLLVELRASRSDGAGMRPVRSRLTHREWETLDLLCRGRSTREIAEQLVLSVETVRTHVKGVLRALRVHSRAEAIAWAGEERATMLRADGAREDPEPDDDGPATWSRARTPPPGEEPGPGRRPDARAVGLARARRS